MSQRITVNKNILHHEKGVIPDILPFDSKYGKKEIIIDNTVGDEGFWILNEDGYYTKVSINPTIIEGLTDAEVRQIARDIIAGDAASNFAKKSQLSELSGNVETIRQELSGSVETLANEVSGLTEQIGTSGERITEYIDEKISQIDATDLAGVTQENLDAIAALVDLIEHNQPILEAIRIAIDGHVALTRAQYDELITNGKVTIGDRLIVYNSKTYYNIYEEEGGDEDSYEYDEETGMLAILGDVSIDEDGMVEISATVDSDGYITVNGDESEDEEIVVDDNGLIEVSDEQIDEDGFINIPDSWEIM